MVSFFDSLALERGMDNSAFLRSETVLENLTLMEYGVLAMLSVIVHFWVANVLRCAMTSIMIKFWIPLAHSNVCPVRWIMGMVHLLVAWPPFIHVYT